LGMVQNGTLNTPTLTKAMMLDPEIRKYGKDAPDFARKLAEDLVKRSKEELVRIGLKFDELDFLKSAEKFLAQELQCQVNVFSAEDPERDDPMNKARVAQPRRPAIYVE
jgi:leucyl-tRNA synthetase